MTNRKGLTRRQVLAGSVGLGAAIMLRPRFSRADASSTLVGAYGGAGSNGVARLNQMQTWLGEPVNTMIDSMPYGTWAYAYGPGGGGDWAAKYGWSRTTRNMVIGCPL